MEFMLGGIEVDGSGWPATADRGRYVVPDLPRANYKVWVRGYGLLDSAKVNIQSGNVRVPSTWRDTVPGTRAEARRCWAWALRMHQHNPRNKRCSKTAGCDAYSTNHRQPCRRAFFNAQT
jgi:hypothetical protein